ncbi:MAG: HAD family hydrolase [Burkholderiaceae bacterium]
MNLVIFDLDGTLIETAGEIGLAVNRTLEDFELDPVSDSDVRRWIGHGTGWLMKQAWKDKVGDPEETNWDAVMSRFIHHYFETAGSQSHPYPFVMETLEKLRALGVQCAILTNKEGRFTERVLRAHGLDQGQFARVISGDTLPTKKPHPGGIHHLMGELGESTGTTLFVGDSEIDVATAKAAGVMCWAVPYGYNHGRPISQADPDRIVDDMRPVASYFTALH